MEAKASDENDDVPFQIGRLGAALTLTRNKKKRGRNKKSFGQRIKLTKKTDETK